MKTEHLLILLLIIMAIIILVQAIVISSPKIYEVTATYFGKGIDATSVEKLDNKTTLITHHRFSNK